MPPRCVHASVRPAQVLAHSLTAEEVDDVHAIFSLLDVDGKGHLTHQDMQDAITHKACGRAGAANNH